MYDKFAEIYDLIYSFLDYEKSVGMIKDLIENDKLSNGNKLLDVGCGTGEHIKFFKKYFACTGVDISEQMLDYAKEKISDVRFIQADMVNMDLKDKFDIITCLFSAIGYVKTLENLRKTINNFANHLNQGGILIIEPWLRPSIFTPGLPSMETYEDDDIKIARLNVSKIDGNISSFVMHFLIAKRNENVTYFKETHELGLFETEQTKNIMIEAGFETKYLEEGLEVQRGLFIGIKK